MDPDPDPPIQTSDKWIRIRILLFSSVTFKTSTKNYFFPSIFCFLLFEGTFTSFFKDKKSQRSHKTVGINFFLTIFAWWKKDPDPYIWIMDPDADPRGPKTYGHMVPRDPDPQDWFQETVSRDGVFHMVQNIWSVKYFFSVRPPMVNNIFFVALHHTGRLQFLSWKEQPPGMEVFFIRSKKMIQ